jgi:hypothetical protein
MRQLKQFVADPSCLEQLCSRRKDVKGPLVNELFVSMTPDLDVVGHLDHDAVTAFDQVEASTVTFE